MSIARAGGIPPLVAVLTAYAGDAAVVASACAALSNIAAHADNTVPIARAGCRCIPALVAVLTAHAGCAAVAESACGALIGLASSCENRVSIARAGGIAPAIAVLQRHDGAPGAVQARGLLLLLSSEPSLETMVAAAGFSA